MTLGLERVAFCHIIYIYKYVVCDELFDEVQK